MKIKLASKECERNLLEVLNVSASVEPLGPENVCASLKRIRLVWK